MPNYPFVLCFLTRGSQVLLLHRLFPPNQGLWNGVGGRIEAGETPTEACRREVAEETGFKISRPRFAGTLTWQGFEISDGGLYLFMCKAPAGEPQACSEGTLAWKDRSWILHSPEVVSNLQIVCPYLFKHARPRNFHFIYKDQHILRYTIHWLAQESFS